LIVRTVRRRTDVRAASRSGPAVCGVIVVVAMVSSLGFGFGSAAADARIVCVH
jgi:hypothetical protein